MNRLAIASIRSRLGSFVATALTILLGTTLITGFSSLIETASALGVAATEAEMLIVMGAVVGGWGTLIVLGAVASTVSITVRQRGEELTALRVIGATNRQVRALVRRETLFVAAASAVIGLAPGWALGRFILELFDDAGLVASQTEHILGLTTIGIVLTGIVFVSVLAATLAVRRVTRRDVAPTDGIDHNRNQWPCMTLGVALLLGALVQGIVAVVTASSDDDPFLAMQLTGVLSIVAAIGLGLLAPPLLRGVSCVLAPIMNATGAPAYLANTSLVRRSGRATGTLIPIIIFVGVAVGILVLMAVQNTADDGAAAFAESTTIGLVNYVVVAMIAIFAAVIIVTTVTATTLDKRNELAKIRLIGATRHEALRSVTAESLVLTGVGILLGLAAATATIVPFAAIKSAGVLPAQSIWIVLGVIVVATIVTMTTATLVGWRAVAERPVRAATS